MNWYVYRDGQNYGPYDLVALGAFIVPDDQVCAEGSSEWRRAGDLPEFSVFFPGAPIEPVSAPGVEEPPLEWYFHPAGKPERGPVSWDAIKRMLDRNELTAKDSVRHSGWHASHPLSSTKLFRLWKTDKVPLNLLPIDQVLREPEAVSAAPAPVLAAPVRSGGAKWREHLAGIRELGWAGKAAVLLVLLLPVIGYVGYQYFFVGSELQASWKYGTPTGDCSSDSVSHAACEDSPEFCGCTTKGSCGMVKCKYYTEVGTPAAR